VFHGAAVGHGEAEAGTSRLDRVEKRWAPAGIGVGAVLLALLAWGVALTATTPPGAPSPAGWLASATGTAFDVSAAATIGLLLLGVVALDPARDEFRRALDSVAVTAGVMTVLGAATALLSTDSSAWLTAALFGAVITTLCVLVRSPGGAAFLLATALAGLWPLADADSTGLAPGGAAELMLHVAFACLWLGALIAVLVLRPALGPARWPVIVHRLRPLVGVAFVVVAASGIQEAAARLGSWQEFPGAYGALLIAVSALLAAIVVVGVVVRARARGRVVGDRSSAAAPTSTLRYLAIQVALLTVAFGISAVLPLRRAAVPRLSGAELSPAEVLTRRPLPAPPGLLGLLVQWRIDLPWALAFVFAAFFYLAGVRRLRRSGHRWPLPRTVVWLAGLAIGFWATSGAPGVYRPYLFSVQLGADLLWAAVVPVFLALGAPVALAIRASASRADGSRGLREWVRSVGRSRAISFFGHPAVSSVVFAGSVWAFTVGPLLRWSTTNSFGHGWAQLQLLVAGLLYAGTVLRARRRAPGAAAVWIVPVAAVLVGIGVWTATTGGLLLADWFGAMGRTWGLPPTADQRLGGALFAVASAVLAVVALALCGWRQAARRRPHRP
jgi:putative copper resistance protein D